MKATGLILAGGKSSRMGRDKALLEVDGEILIVRCIEKLRPLVGELFIASGRLGQYSYPGVTEVADFLSGIGPLAGIQAGLTVAGNEYVLVTATDLPFLDENVAKLLLDSCEGYDVTVPRVGRDLQPLFAVYRKTCLPYIERNLAQGIKKVSAFYPEVLVNFIDEALIRTVADPYLVFYNMNTPEEYRDVTGKVEGGHVSVNKIPVISIVGFSNSGKTTLLEKVVKELKTRGIGVAVIKHHHGDFTIDKPGKDTWRYAEAGANVVVLSGPTQVAFIEKRHQELTLDEVITKISGVDVIITEGYKSEDKPKIIVARQEISQDIPHVPGELLAIVSDLCWDRDVPCFDLNDIAGVADLIMSYISRSKTGTAEGGK